jgi:hypothetical protein
VYSQAKIPPSVCSSGLGPFTGPVIFANSPSVTSLHGSGSAGDAACAESAAQLARVAVTQGKMLDHRRVDDVMVAPLGLPVIE